MCLQGIGRGYLGREYRERSEESQRQNLGGMTVIRGLLEEKPQRR